jgi:hypothetical protein
MSNAPLTIASSKTSIAEAIQLIINNNPYPTFSVGGHKFLGMPINEYLKIDPVPINRNSENRVGTMKSTFDEQYFQNHIDTLTSIALGIVVNAFVDPDLGTEYNPGDCYILDGNTRKYYWLSYPDKAKLTGPLAAKVHYLQTFDDLESSYYSYDNKKSAETNSQILQGQIRRYNYNFKQNVFANGGFGTAIQIASHTKQGQKLIDIPDVWGQFEINFDGLKILDSIPKGDGKGITGPKIKSLKSQVIIAALLTELRYHPTNLKLHDFVERLANIEIEELKTAFLNGELDPVQVIAAEYSGYSAQRSNTGLAAPWLNGAAGSTKFASIRPQMDFLIYWIEEYRQYGKSKTVDANRGVKPTFWTDGKEGKGAWEEFLPV